jgi:hypothetical protein
MAFVPFTSIYAAFKELDIIKDEEDLRKAIEKKNYELIPETKHSNIVEYLESNNVTALRKYLKKKQSAERNLLNRGSHSLEGKLNKKL